MAQDAGAAQGGDNHALHARGVQGLGFDAVESGGCEIGREELHRADAVTPDRREEIERGRRSGVESAAEAEPDGVAVGEEIVEIVFDGGPAVWRIPGCEGQGEGQHARRRRRDPPRIVLE